MAPLVVTAEVDPAWQLSAPNRAPTSQTKGMVAHINEINNDRFIREVMAAQVPKPVVAVNKAWLKQHEDVFVLLRAADNNSYIALTKAVQTRKATKPAKSASDPQKTPAYQQVVQKSGRGDPKPLVYNYSAKAREAWVSLGRGRSRPSKRQSTWYVGGDRVQVKRGLRAETELGCSNGPFENASTQEDI